MSTAKNQVLICGAGVGGLALGIRLRRLGFHPLIVERQIGVRPQIKGEYFQPAGVKALNQLGLLDAILQAGGVKIDTLSHGFKSPVTGTLNRFESHFEGDFESSWELKFGVAILHEDILHTLRKVYQDLGGELREGVYVAKMGFGSDEQPFVQLSSGETLLPLAFIGGDGRHGVTRKQAGLEVLDLPCERSMMATLIQGLNLRMGEFYTEETPAGVFYAFQYASGLARVYVCFNNEDLTRANANKESFLMSEIKDSPIYASGAHVHGPIMLMPTADCMLKESVRGSAIWFGDAAGTLDPLGGHGMTMALTDAIRIADAIAQHHESRPDLRAAFAEVARASKSDYLRYRFLSQWLGTLFMAKKKRIRIMKWHAFRRYSHDVTLRKRLLGFFSGTEQGDFAVYDLPYFLGVLPTELRAGFENLRLSHVFSKAQNRLLTSPISLYKHELKKKTLGFVQRMI